MAVRCIYVILLCSMVSNKIFLNVATHVSSDGKRDKCRVSEIMGEYYKQNNGALREMQEFERKIQSFISKRQQSMSYIIPVVFHVYGTYFGGKTVNDNTIIRALEKVNEDFHGLNNDFHTVHPAFRNVRSTLNVTFQLPRKGPNGEKTTGIIYYPSKNGYAGSNHDEDIQKEAWDNYKYCNIFIQYDLLGNGFVYSSGFAFYPSTWMSDRNLARIIYNGAYLYGNTDDEFASTLTHEFGHWLNLLHTFEETCSSANEYQCDTTGDKVCDTPQTSDTQSCGESYNCVGKLINTENYMDYTGATHQCYKMFTAGQTARMEATLRHPARITLWQRENLVATGLADEDLTTTTTTTTISTTTGGPCLNAPCKNGGTCYQNNNNYFCFCTLQWKGATCEINSAVPTTTTPSSISCSPNPCNNGGTCYPSANGFFCFCKLAYSGRTCGEMI